MRERGEMRDMRVERVPTLAQLTVGEKHQGSLVDHEGLTETLEESERASKNNVTTKKKKKSL